MKLPWYITQTGIKQTGAVSKGNRLYWTFKVRKAWIYLMRVKIFFGMIRKEI